MDSERQQENGTPWYARSKAWIIGAGALAAAGLAVLSLGDRLFPADVEDVARIESVDLVGQASFKEFASKGFGVELPLAPAPAAAPGDAAAVVRAAASEPAASVAPDTSTTPPETPATDAPTLSTTRPPTTPPASPELLDPELWTPPDAYLQTMLAHPSVETFEFTEDELRASLVVIEPSGAGGEELPPEEVVSRVAAALDDVETTADEEGALDPDGWTIAVNLTIEGLAGVPLVLTWSLDGVSVPEDWAAEKVTYRVIADTPRDVGSAEIWVPRLKAAGEYNVNVKLRLASDGTTLAHGTPLSI